MRKKNFKGRCEKRKLSKCEDVCRTFDAIQYAYADLLNGSGDIKSFRVNVLLDGIKCPAHILTFRQLPLFTSSFKILLSHYETPPMSGITGIQAYSSLSQNGNVTFGEIPKTDTLFPKAKSPKSSKSASLFLGNRNPHFTGTPKNRIPKISSQKWFLGKSLCSGANPIILKRQTSVSSPHFSPKWIRVIFHWIFYL